MVTGERLSFVPVVRQKVTPELGSPCGPRPGSLTNRAVALRAVGIEDLGPRVDHGRVDPAVGFGSAVE
jgi:hypothetical protein